MCHILDSLINGSLDSTDILCVEFGENLECISIQNIMEYSYFLKKKKKKKKKLEKNHGVAASLLEIHI